MPHPLRLAPSIPDPAHRRRGFNAASPYSGAAHGFYQFACFALAPRQAGIRAAHSAARIVREDLA